ncbi:MAG: hypothetical protein AzoDbin1_04228 [Azoarcus sp.]|nr:hypothetical protein [Azoarcus sp.]
MRYSNYSLTVSVEAEADLEALYEVDEDGAADIDVFIDEALGSQDILGRLSEIRYYRSYAQDGARDYEIQRWEALWRKFALLRIKLYDVPTVATQYRIIYAFHPSEQRIYILGIVSRAFDYDPEHPVSKRIIAAYRNLDIP